MRKIIFFVAVMLFASSYISALTVYEAESGAKNGNAVSTANASASGGQVVANFSVTGDFSKILPANGEGGGAGTVTIHYSNSGPDATLSFFTYDTNGSNPTQLQKVIFPSTGSATTFADVVVNMTFLAGNVNGNGFKVQNGGDGAAGATVAIDKYTVELTVATGFEPTTAKSKFTVLSKGTNEIEILTDGSANYDLAIFNLCGQKLISKINISGNTEIKSSALSSGVYFVKVVSNGKTITQKVIVK